MLTEKKIRRDSARVIKNFANLARSQKFHRDLIRLRRKYGHDHIEAGKTKALYESQPSPKDQYVSYEDRVHSRLNSKEAQRNKRILKSIGRMKESGSKWTVPPMSPLSKKEKNYLMGRVIVAATKIPNAAIHKFAFKWNMRQRDASDILLYDRYPSPIPLKGRYSKSQARKRRKPNPKRFWWDQRIRQSAAKDFVLSRPSLSVRQICDQWPHENSLNEETVRKIRQRDKKKKGH